MDAGSMFEKLKRAVDLSKNMGVRYMSYRISHAIKSKTGYYKRNFPSTEEQRFFISLEDWKQSEIPFFIESKESLKLNKSLSAELESRFRESVNNTHTFFSHKKIQLEDKTQWSVNPDTGYKYDMNKHWSDIQDLSKSAGDIKYVWEKARFSHVYDLIRYDYHSDTDQFGRVFKDVIDFIDRNPMNLGPQYKCSQEISLRVMNWTYALYYFKNNDALTDVIFQKVISSIYFQLKHVRSHINFSRIAVRNNHAITETLMLYLSGLLFPFIPESEEWSSQGEKWFEQEIAYQIYEDGTFLQHSMNYHRVVVQLLTWAIVLTHKNHHKFSPIVYDKAHKSLRFLEVCMDVKSGILPNYGNNDGALFFKLNDKDYRDYTTQLNSLRAALTGETFEKAEELHWYGLENAKEADGNNLGMYQFHNGGYYVFNESDTTKTFLKCGAYQDRPFQADNLHLDIWKHGKNYLWDCGTYKYNTDKEYLDHFQGSAGHNTATIDGKDHMVKGSRFVWFYWIKTASGSMREGEDAIEWDLQQTAYRNLGSVEMNRKVVKIKNKSHWKIIDTIDHLNGEEFQQHWQLNPALEKELTIQAMDQEGNKLSPIKEEKWYSGYYGSKEKSIKLTFATGTKQITTLITINA